MSLPRIGAAEWGAAQASPWDVVNLALRLLDSGACRFLVEDRDLTAPPGSCSDGACYLVAASPTGAWSGQAGKLAVAIGTNASNGWQFITVAIEGVDLYLRDENITIEYDGTQWLASAGPVKVPTTQSGTTYTAVMADQGGYIQFTNIAAVAFTIPPNASVAFPIGTVITVEQNNIGGVTFTPGAGVTLRSRGGYLQTAGQYAVAQAKKVATNTWTVIGDVA